MADSPDHLNHPHPGETAVTRVQALQQRADQAGIMLRIPPAPPTSCCGRGCNGCVWEGYFSALDYWCGEAAQAMLSIQ